MEVEFSRVGGEDERREEKAKRGGKECMRRKRVGEESEAG